MFPEISLDQARTRLSDHHFFDIQSRELNPTGFGVSIQEARTIVSFISLSGAVYSCTNASPDLPKERLRLIQMTMPSSPIVPIDLFSRGSDCWRTFEKKAPDGYDINHYPSILDLKVNANSGIYDVVAMTNWSRERAVRRLSFSEKLGLDDDQRFVVFDFWKQRLVGTFDREMIVEIEPHDTRVFFIRRLLDRPQLIGTSRHITGAVSIRNLSWDNSASTLRGVSRTVPDSEYSFWIHVPDGISLKGLSARDDRVHLESKIKGESLEVRFSGQEEPVQWSAEFSPKTLGSQINRDAESLDLQH